MSGVYYVGQVVELSGVFTRTSTGNPEDPASATLVVIAPDGTQSDVEVDIPAGSPTGDWSAEFTADQAGIWQYRLESVQLVAVAEGSLYVSPSVVPAGVGS